jgi:tetratricopeptide (TPR) repeat protein
MKQIEKARIEINRGRLWKAKEILRGAIGQREYDLDLYRAYGELLLKMGELPEAGKYLFLSGSESVDHESAVQEFLRRWGAHGSRLLYSRFPARARVFPVSRYPRNVRAVLTDGFEPPKHLVVDPQPQDSKWPKQAKDAIALFGCAAVLFSVLLLSLFGLFSILKPLFWAD